VQLIGTRSIKGKLSALIRNTRVLNSDEGLAALQAFLRRYRPLSWSAFFDPKVSLAKRSVTSSLDPPFLSEQTDTKYRRCKHKSRRFSVEGEMISILCGFAVDPRILAALIVGCQLPQPQARILRFQGSKIGKRLQEISQAARRSIIVAERTRSIDSIMVTVNQLAESHMLNLRTYLSKIEGAARFL
jgi:hypothetical protein